MNGVLRKLNIPVSFTFTSHSPRDQRASSGIRIHAKEAIGAELLFGKKEYDVTPNLIVIKFRLSVF